MFKQREWKYRLRVKIWLLRLNENTFLSCLLLSFPRLDLTVCGSCCPYGTRNTEYISSAVSALIPARLFDPVQPYQPHIKYPVYPISILPLSSQHRSQRDNSSEMNRLMQNSPELLWSCERDASPWTGLTKLCQTQCQQLPTPLGASGQPQPQGHPSRNAFCRHLGMFKDLCWLNIVVFEEQNFHRVSAASTKLLGGIGRHRVGEKKIKGSQKAAC